jgi:LmbE family N-acetylglucosaminyl deacetylase
MKWIYLSPHFDDAALSCGGLIWQQSSAGQEVQVWTICAGNPGESISPFAQELHQRWQTGELAVAQRRIEDDDSNQILQADSRYFQVLDCIYRRDDQGSFLYPTEESLFGEINPLEGGLIESLASDMDRVVGEEEVQVVCPLSLGGHVDHRLTRAAAELWAQQKGGIQLWYYADYPYVLKNMDTLGRWTGEGWQKQVFPLSPDSVQAWCSAVAAHVSQISTFWRYDQAMCQAIRSYYALNKGAALYFNSNKVE